jgi:hypothetical protein
MPCADNMASRRNDFGALSEKHAPGDVHVRDKGGVFKKNHRCECSDRDNLSIHTAKFEKEAALAPCVHYGGAQIV